MILARYLIAQFFPPFLFGLSLFSGVLLLDKVFDLIDLLINKGVSFALSAKIFLLFLPTIFSLSVPMSLLLACLLTFGRLSEDNEIIALRASGLSFAQILWPPLLLAAALSISLIPFNTRLAPRAMNKFRGLFHKIATTEPLLQIEPRRFLSVQNIHLFVHSVSRDRKHLKDVWIYQMFPTYTQRVYAERGTADVNDQRLQLDLESGQMERFSRGNTGDFVHTQFERYSVSAPFAGAPGSRDRSWREYESRELRGEIGRRTDKHLPVSEARAEFHLRYAMAFSPLALALIGIPLGVALERGGRGVGFGASLGVIFFYYLFLMLGLNLAEKGSLPAGPALWIGNLSVAAAGLFLYRRRLSQ